MKTKNFDGSLYLERGKVYCNLPKKQTVFVVEYPETELRICNEKGICIEKSGKTEFVDFDANFSDNQFFLLLLKGKFDNLGLENSEFELKSVEKQDTLTVSKWISRGKEKKNSSAILISKRKNRIFGAAWINEKGEAPLKIFFDTYQIVSTLNIPTEIFKIFTSDGKEAYEKTNFENIRINDFSDNTFYDILSPCP